MAGTALHQVSIDNSPTYCGADPPHVVNETVGGQLRPSRKLTPQVLP